MAARLQIMNVTRLCRLVMGCQKAVEHVSTGIFLHLGFVRLSDLSFAHAVVTESVVR